MKLETKNLPHENYGEMLEAFYGDLVLKEKAGKISSATHQALELFLDELRDMVAEANPTKLPKAA